jgi:hypothetical protein
MAENRRPLLSLLFTALLLTTTSISVVSGQPAGECLGEWLICENDSELMYFVLSGVFLSLNGVIIPNDGYVHISDIGIGGGGLHCNSDKSDCCRGAYATDGVAQGHWYRPDGTLVGSFTQEDSSDPTRNFFSRDRGTGVVRLSRYGNPPERGRFRCEVPNAAGNMVTVYMNIGT